MLLGAEKQAVVGEVSVAQTRLVAVEAGAAWIWGELWTWRRKPKCMMG